MRVKKLIIAGAAITGAAAASLLTGAGLANAAVADGTYNLCVETRFGSSVEQKCATYEVKGDELIGSAGVPLKLVSTPTGGYADIDTLNRITLTKTDDGYRAVNSTLGIPVASSTFNPVTEADENDE